MHSWKTIVGCVCWLLLLVAYMQHTYLNLQPNHKGTFLSPLNFDFLYGKASPYPSPPPKVCDRSDCLVLSCKKEHFLSTLCGFGAGDCCGDFSVVFYPMSFCWWPWSRYFLTFFFYYEQMIALVAKIYCKNLLKDQWRKIMSLLWWRPVFHPSPGQNLR